MTTYPDDFIGIQLHLGDSYQTSWTQQRGNFYAVTGYPDTWFDGISEAPGAYTNDTQMYNWYSGFYATRHSTPTDTTIDLSVVRTDEQEFAVTCTIGIDAAGVGKDLKAHIVQVLDYYPSYGDNRYRNCTVQHLGSSNFTLAAGEKFSFTQTFTITDSTSPPFPCWTNRTNVKFIAFVRDQGSTGPREIHNSTQVQWPFYVDGDVDRDGDVDLSDLAALLAAYNTCEGDANYVPEADFNWDHCITLADLATLLANYGYVP